ncbi:MAG TPA: ATP-binding cassette domain-containing protein [Fimbriimonadaceae bacterium]|nr:ATP-binding cassette domain-containing protein [Fimbriimonadaceae bacterium]
MLRRLAQRADSELVFDHVSLVKSGPTLALRVPTGSTVAIMGAANSGKTKLLRSILGQASVARGKITIPGEGIFVGDSEWSRRETPTSVARRILGKGSLQLFTEAISALGLWDIRQKSCASLGAGHQNAVHFIPALLESSKVICTDHGFDLLDISILESLWSFLRQRLTDERVLVYSTARPDIGERADQVIVLKDQQIAFSGSPEELRRTQVETEFEVVTENQPGVRALVEPFQISVQEIPDGLRIRAEEGQAIAARLLVEGYGDVRYVVQRPPSFRDALSRLI